MRKTALMLSLCLLLSGCAGQGRESRVDPAKPSSAAAMSPAPPSVDPERPSAAGKEVLAVETPSAARTPEPTAPTGPTAPPRPTPEQTSPPTPVPANPSTPAVSEVPAPGGLPPAPAVESMAPPPLESWSPTNVFGYDFGQPVPESAPVGPDYFADAVFIGDSRTEGFRMFSGLNQGDYLAHTGLMVFRIFKTEITVDGEKMTALDGLARKNYGKVYIALGVNELGMFDDQGYYDHFAQLVDQVRVLQPNATLYIQLIIPVNSQKCREKGQSEYVTNAQIDVYNDLLRRLAVEKRVYLVDPAEALVDESGEVPYDLTADGVHLQKAGYELWYDYLCKHTVNWGEAE